ncbi:MBL fold metallo-hydrolase [Motilibacter aurantiacus]|uniref:MBL fold metallo-hydrolase n=1 Tax=Motilibacter aurantiacus TaxID=2714955 RepID=UPI0014099459|nr:MBL fold metallo-hydrolase [Motilibacter aurantiacus]
MQVTVVGCSGSLPAPGNAASCYLVEAGGTKLVLDVGSGALGPLQAATSLTDVDAVVLSHLHPDHCMDLCGWYVFARYHPDVLRSGRPGPRLRVYGPSGTLARLAGAYGGVGPEQMAAVFDVVELQDGETYQIGEMRFTVARVAHPVEAYATRVEHGGSSLAYSGDTGRSDALVRLAADVDLLLCEASFLVGVDDEAPEGLHLTARDAGEHAARARARRVLLTHVPPWGDPVRALAQARSAYPGPLALARAGDVHQVRPRR